MNSLLHFCAFLACCSASFIIPVLDIFSTVPLSAFIGLAGLFAAWPDTIILISFGGCNMDNTTIKRGCRDQVEHHTTAAWAQIQAMKRVSKVTIPDERHVSDAKEYVDSNEK
jgi:hypothetical protein